MTTLLSEDEYKSTMTPKMVNVTETAEPIVDIWEYVEELTLENIVEKQVLEDGLVDKVYRNQTNTFDHILLPTSKENIFTVIIVDLNKESIKGYYPLDLNVEFGLV